MTVFAGAIKHRITIAGVDVSELVGGGGTFFGVSDSKIDRGLILTSGSIAIMDNGTIDLDSRTNPTFSRGAPVIVEIELVNSSGVRAWFPHPRGALRILRDPAPPYPGNEFIEIEVGCLLTLLDFASPPDEDKQDKETKKEEKTRSQLINEILTNLSKDQGIPNIQLQDTIADFPIAVEASKISSGSYISLCGDIAFGGGHALWIDNRERLRAVRIIPEKISHYFPDIVIGGDDGMEISYKPISGVEIPPSKYLFTADGDPSDGEEEGGEEDDGCMTRKVYGSMADLHPDGRILHELWLIEEKKCDRWEEDGDGWIRWITTSIKRRSGLVFQSREGQGILPREEGIQEKWYYNSDGILYKRETFEQRMPGEILKSLMDQIPDEVEKEDGKVVNNYRSIFKNFNTATGVRPIREVVEHWFFDEDTGVINKYTKSIKEPKGAVTSSYYKFEMWRDKKYVTDEAKEGEEGTEGKDEGKKMFPAQIEEEFGYWPFDSAYDLFNNANSIMYLVTTYKEEQTWEEFRKDEWQWNKVVWQSQGRISSGDDTVSREDATGLRIDMEESEYILSNSGDSQPPEPETMTDAMQEGGTKETENIECEVEMSVPAYAEYRPKKKEVRLEFIKNEENLCAIGHAIAAIDQGRVWLHELVLPLTLDIVENFQPVGFIKVQEHGRSRFSSDDRTFIYIAEGLSWTLENDTALVSMDLILYNSAPNFFNRTYQWHSKPNPPPIIPLDPNEPIPPTPSPIPVPAPAPAPSPTPTPTPVVIIPRPIPVTKGGWKYGGSTQWFNFDPNTPEEFDLATEWNYGGMVIHGDQITELESEYLYGSDLSEAYIPYVVTEYLWGYTGKTTQIIPKIISAEAWVGYGGNLVYILGEIHGLTGGFSYGGILEYEDQSSVIAALNPRFWFRSDQGITLDLTTYEGISAWQNQGSADSLSQPIKANQPQYFKVGKIDAAYFDNPTFLGAVDSGTVKAYYGFTAIVRSVNPVWSGHGQIFSYPAQDAPYGRSYLFETGQTYFNGIPFPVSVRRNKTSVSSPFNVSPIDEWFCISVIFNPAYINNSISGSENWRINRSFENYYLGFYLAEIVVHDIGLDASVIEGIENEMMNRWNIGISSYSDIASFEPYYWFRSDMGVTIDTSSGTNSISSWENQGSGEDAIQTTKVNQPLIYSDANLGNTVHFTGSSWLSNHAKSSPHVYGMCAVLRSVGASWSSYGQVFSYPAQDAPHGRSYLFESGQTYFNGTPFPVSVRRNKTSVSSPFNVSPIDSFFCLTVVWGSAYKKSSIRDSINFYIGRSFEGYMCQVYIAEIVIFSDSYSIADIAKIEDEMIARWGI